MLNAQHDTISNVVISDIILDGNDVTKSSIILKELTFSLGDTINIHDFEEEIRLSKENIQNTTLFNFVDVKCIRDDNKPDELTIFISVTERWYLWVYPYVSYADRNINAWYEADEFERFSYGFDVEHRNFFGLKHSIKLTFISGYNQNYGVTYDFPDIIQKYNLGLKSGVA